MHYQSTDTHKTESFCKTHTHLRTNKNSKLLDGGGGGGSFLRNYGAALVGEWKSNIRSRLIYCWGHRYQVSFFSYSINAESRVLCLLIFATSKHKAKVKHTKFLKLVLFYNFIFLILNKYCVMLCYVTLCYVTLCYVMLCYVM